MTMQNLNHYHNHDTDLESARKEAEREIEKNVEKESGQNPQEKIHEKAQEEKPLQESWPGRVQNGELYCLCNGNHKAMCLTVKFSKANKGKKYWRCRKDETERCTLYIWDTDYARAKAWLAEHGPPPLPLYPQTPQGKAREAEAAARSLQNPWTLAKSTTKRKAKSISRDVSDEDENGNGNGLGPTAVVTPGTESDEVEVGDPNSPSRKTTKRKRRDTPSALLSERAQTQTAANSLPTPNTAKHPEPTHPFPLPFPYPIPAPLNPREIAEASVRLGEVIDLTDEPKNNDLIVEPKNTKDTKDKEIRSNLTLAILEELKSAKVQLKASTETYIAHLIDTEMELHDTRMRRVQITISRLKKRLDEMECALVVMAGDDAVELSD